ncbi:MAG: hypothetical protein F4X16_11345 [Caldilineaceae bacterium SB0661_bin_34]|nr:hypothetical protein [Caldilineaceae bacterium SB0661_bin_34]
MLIRASVYSQRADSSGHIAPGLEMCVQGVSGTATGFSMLKVATEAGETGWPRGCPWTER